MRMLRPAGSGPTDHARDGVGRVVGWPV